MGKASGEFMGVQADWYQTLQIDAPRLEEVFASIRADSRYQGCGHFPSRDDLAANETLFREVIARYQRITGAEISREFNPEFRRWILLTYKAGGTPT